MSARNAMPRRRGPRRTLDTGRARSVYLTDDDCAAAKSLSRSGTISDGLREALRIASSFRAAQAAARDSRATD